MVFEVGCLLCGDVVWFVVLAVKWVYWFMGFVVCSGSGVTGFVAFSLQDFFWFGGLGVGEVGGFGI